MRPASRRMRTKLRDSVSSYATVMPFISVVAADVVVQIASAKPTTVMAMPEPGDSVERRRLSRRSVAASSGITVCARSMSDSTVVASATSEKTPSTTSRDAGIARNSENASACATVVTSSSRASCIARRKTIHVSEIHICMPGWDSSIARWKNTRGGSRAASRGSCYWGSSTGQANLDEPVARDAAETRDRPASTP